MSVIQRGLLCAKRGQTNKFDRQSEIVLNNAGELKLPVAD